MKPVILTIAAALVLATGGCKDDAPKQAAAAGGELLPRSVSDEMPPYDTVRSQPRLANPDAAPRPAAQASASAADSVEDVVVEAAEPDPAE